MNEVQVEELFHNNFIWSEKNFKKKVELAYRFLLLSSESFLYIFSFCWFFGCSCCFWWSTRTFLFFFFCCVFSSVGIYFHISFSHKNERDENRGGGAAAAATLEQKCRWFYLSCLYSLVFAPSMRVKKLVLYDGPPTRFV